MHLAVFGGSGHTGRWLLDQALQHGDTVTALARDPSRLVVHERLRPVAGDVRDTDLVEKVVAGSDAVLSALGQRKWGTTVCTDGARAILPAMDTHGVRRLIAVSGYGVADSRHRRNLYVAVNRVLIRSLMRDKEGMEELIRASGTAWTIVRPAVLTDGPRTGHHRSGTGLRLTFASKISYADLADFMLAQLTQDDLVHRAVAVTA